MQDEQGRFDLLLSDIKMPVMDGIALALNVAAAWPDVTIVLMTGFADQRERAHGLDAADLRRDPQAVHAGGGAGEGRRRARRPAAGNHLAGPSGDDGLSG